MTRADAFDSLKVSRRETLWHVAALETDELPLFRPQDVTERTGNIHNAKSFTDNNPGGLQSRVRDGDDIQLPSLREEEAVAEDYAASVFRCGTIPSRSCARSYARKEW